MLVNEFIKSNRRVNRVFIHCSASDITAYDSVNVIRQPEHSIEVELADFRSTTASIPQLQRGNIIRAPLKTHPKSPIW
ncbi:hypothetical protein [Sulfurovum sp. NBC37-1]|uniref:hypothetical protein n=1 Tax=Sulfurovum sp. (strain NBC37-1) TaxID=387093 RepID=UPI0002DDCDF6|nr:hypothetical protein [Sulfurovum sp. NBC37-1]